MQPALETPRVRLRPAALSDLDALWTLWTLPDVRRYLWDDRIITRDEAAATLDDCVALAPTGLGLWIIEAGADSEGFGCAGLLPVSTAGDYDPRFVGLVEPLVALRPAVWGCGCAAEALTALLDHAGGTRGSPGLRTCRTRHRIACCGAPAFA